MKALALFFALSLYLLPSPAHSARNPIRLPTAVASGTPVLDTDGDELRAGDSYYIIAAQSGPSTQAVKLAGLDWPMMSKCPSDVILSVTDIGDPVAITPADPNATVVSLSTYLSFKFDVATNKLCVSNVYWGIQKSGLYFLKAGEFVPDQSNRFKIEAQPDIVNAYKITYCPFGTDSCYNVGRQIDPWWRTQRLALTDFSPFAVHFKKATTSA